MLAYDVTLDYFHPKISRAIYLVKAVVPAFLAYFFCFISHKVEDLLYYQLYAYLLSFVLMMLMPDEQSYVMNSENESEMPYQMGRRSRNTSNTPFDSKKIPGSNEAQMVALTARGFKLKKILKALKATKEFTRTLPFMVMMTCINGFSTCLIHFGLNNLHGDIFMNGLVLSVADLSAYAFSLYIR